jgi:hypothetical protein
MLYDVDPNARRRVVAEFALEVKTEGPGRAGVAHPTGGREVRLRGLKRRGPSARRLPQGRRPAHDVGDVVEVDGVKFLRTLTGSEIIP